MYIITTRNIISQSMWCTLKLNYHNRFKINSYISDSYLAIKCAWNTFFRTLPIFPGISKWRYIPLLLPIAFNVGALSQRIPEFYVLNGVMNIMKLQSMFEMMGKMLCLNTGKYWSISCGTPLTPSIKLPVTIEVFQMN